MSQEQQPQVDDNTDINTNSDETSVDSQAVSPETDKDESSSISIEEQLQARIESLQAEVKVAKDAQARANAESYNAQKRMEQETDKAKKFALQRFAKDLLEVVDNLERAIISVQNDADADDAIMEGVKLTHKSLLTVLNKNGVEVVDPLGEKFNPDYHEAVGIYPDAEPDHVGVVLQKGYTLHGRSIRPAMVQIGG